MSEDLTTPNLPTQASDTKELSNTVTLTDKNILFIHYIKQGLSTIEAYESAGYKGNAHSAYELRSKLKGEINKMLQGEGLGTREGLLMKLKRLQDLPLVESKLTIKEAMELLKIEAKLQPKEEREVKQSITPIVINITGASVSNPVDKVLEITPIEVDTGE